MHGEMETHGDVGISSVNLKTSVSLCVTKKGNTEMHGEMEGHGDVGISFVNLKTYESLSVTKKGNVD